MSFFEKVSGEMGIPLKGGHWARRVAFDANGGTGTMATQTATKATNLTANSFEREGYTFDEWNTAADGSGTAYANSASFPFTNEVTLYAQWEEEV